MGHSRAQNKPSTWQHLNNQAWQWLQSHVNRSHEQQTTVSSEATVCGDGGPPQRVVGRTPEDLANGALTLQFPPGGTAGDVALADKNGLATDAIARTGCAAGSSPAATPTARPSAATRGSP